MHDNHFGEFLDTSMYITHWPALSTALDQGGFMFTTVASPWTNQSSTPEDVISQKRTPTPMPTML